MPSPAQRAAAYLWSAQSPDGGWHSNTHGIMRDGLALSPYVLHTLLQVPDRIYSPPQDQVIRAMNFIRNSARSTLLEGEEPLVLDYPTYASAYQLMCLSAMHSTRFASLNDRQLMDTLTGYLLAGQFVEHRGIAPDHGAYGGWGFGETNLNYGEIGHVDLSHTRRAVEALANVLPQDHPVFVQAQKYLSNVQNPDGGFFSSLVTPDVNKSARNEQGWHSYATATCDGLLALMACSVSISDFRAKGASAWLQAYPDIPEPAGIPSDDPDQWQKVMRYYHCAARAQAMQKTEIVNNSVQAEISNFLNNTQRPDGSFSNPYGSPNKEDDPLLCTALALRSFCELSAE